MAFGRTLWKVKLFFGTRLWAEVDGIEMSVIVKLDVKRSWDTPCIMGRAVPR